MIHQMDAWLYDKARRKLVALAREVRCYPDVGLKKLMKGFTVGAVHAPLLSDISKT